jgi:ubiquinone/menaquinone biosynthesis C-methylase UbiE
MQATAKFWDNIAERYAKKPVSNPEAFARKIEATRQRLRPDSVVLEIGCGTGSLALQLAPSAGHVHAFDVSGEMVRIAKDKAAMAQVANVSFYQGTLDDVAQVLPELAGTLDCVCVYNLFHLLSDPQAAVARIFSLLAPGGSFVSSTPCLRDGLIPLGPLLTVMRWIGKAPPVTLIAARDLERWMRDAGFSQLETPDVGADRTTAFVLASKPNADRPKA